MDGPRQILRASDPAEVGGKPRVGEVNLGRAHELELQAGARLRPVGFEPPNEADFFRGPQPRLHGLVGDADRDRDLTDMEFPGGALRKLFQKRPERAPHRGAHAPEVLGQSAFKEVFEGGRPGFAAPPLGAR